MKIKVSNTATQTIKSNLKRTIFFNVEDLKFQHSVLEAGISHIKDIQTMVRTNKEFNSLERRKDKLTKVKFSIERAIKNLEQEVLIEKAVSAVLDW